MKKIIACITLFSNLIACQDINMEYKIDVGAYHDEDYYMHTQRCHFLSPDGDYLPVLFVNDGIVGYKTGTVSGDGYEKVPNKLEILYFSLTENKFFEGSFILPYEELVNYFKQKSEEQNNNGQKFNYLSVIITLGGQVTVSISGESDSEQKIIGIYKATEKKDVIWSNYYEYGTREEKINDYMEDGFKEYVKGQILTKTLPYSKWDDYNKKYNWRYVFDFPKDYKFLDISTRLINNEGERVYKSNPNILKDEYKMRPLPFKIDVNLEDNKGVNHKAWLFFTESKSYLLANYKGGEGLLFPRDFREEKFYIKMQELDPLKPIDLIFKLVENKIHFIIKQEDKEFQMNEVTFWYVK